MAFFTDMHGVLTLVEIQDLYVEMQDPYMPRAYASTPTALGPRHMTEFL
jgi:hypothetical protein